MIKLSDIAAKAGVSESTVSRALADSPLVNQKTKDLVQQLAREAGYKVNQVARNLRIQSTRTIGLVVPQVANPYYPKLIQLVADRVKEAGYRLQLHLSGADQESESDCLTSLYEHRADGVLLVTAVNGLVTKSQVESLVASGTPVVLLGWVEGAEHVDLVMADDARGGYMVGKHLVDLGHRDIAVIGARPHRGPFDRLSGFQKALNESGITPNLVSSARSDEEVKAVIHELLSLPKPPTAIFAYQDFVAALVFKHLGAACISIPDQISVVGFDNLDLGTYICPQLTTVDLPADQIAAEAVNLVLARTQNADDDANPKRIVVSPELILRESCAPPRR